MKPTNSPTQGQPNPTKNRLKVAIGPLFPTANIFFVGWDWFYIGNRLQEIPPNQILRKHPNTAVQFNIVQHADGGRYTLVFSGTRYLSNDASECLCIYFIRTKKTPQR